MPVEQHYDFQKRIADVHPANLRDRTRKAAAGETEITSKWRIAIAEDASEYLERVASDLGQFFAQSMAIELECVRGTTGRASKKEIVLRVDSASAPQKKRAYRLDVTADGVEVAGFDERGTGQGAYYLEDLAKLRRAPFLPRGAKRRAPIFSPRMFHSGWKCGEFPDWFLNAAVHAGLDTVLIYTREDLSKEKRDVNDIIRRAGEHGLDVYLYPDFRNCEKHPLDEGADEFYDKLCGGQLKAYPGVKGMVFVGESCAFPSRDPRASGRSWWSQPSKSSKPGHQNGFFPFNDYPDWVKCVRKALRKANSDIDFVMWTYNWGGASDEDRLAFVRALPKDVTLEATFEMFDPVERDGYSFKVADYSLTIPGPGHYFATEAAEAKKRGLRLYTMSNTGGRTWDHGSVPYNPAPHLWKKRWDALNAAARDWNLSGLMECHHFGWVPSFISELAKEAYWTDGMDFDEHIRKIAERDFGAGAAKAMAAWKDWSEAFEYCLPINLDQYGPLRIGPSYPLVLPGEKYEFPEPPGIVFFNYNEDAGWVGKYSADDLAVQTGILRKQEAALASGNAHLAAAFAKAPGDAKPGAERMLALGQFLLATCRTCINSKRWAICKLDIEQAKISEEKLPILGRMRGIAEEELGNVRGTLPAVRTDSELGYEATIRYAGGEERLTWKIGDLERAIRKIDSLLNA